MDKKLATIGTDPEYFLRERGTGKLVSAIPFIKGTKHSPDPLPGGGNIQRDNVAVEFATDPAHSAEDFVAKIGRAFKDVYDRLPPGHDLEVLPSAEFDDDQLDNEEACQFGCSPDFNAWSMEMNNTPHASNKNFRSCGGHIHTGHVEGDGNEFLLEVPGKVRLVRMQDTFHGIISTVLDNSTAAIQRRELYGKAGCHRPTAYGVEYRTLSNYWTKSPILVMLMYSLTQDCLRLIREDKDINLIEEIGEFEIQNIINDGRREEAEIVIEKYLMAHLSKDSIYYFKEAKAKIDVLDFKKEWSIAI